MNLLTLKNKDGHLLYSQDINGDKLEVREREQYRWFHFGGDAIQAIMNIQSSSQVLMPTCQAMLLFTLWKKYSITILNLGMGGATFERYFNNNPRIKITSV